MSMIPKSQLHRGKIISDFASETHNVIISWVWASEHAFLAYNTPKVSVVTFKMHLLPLRDVTLVVIVQLEYFQKYVGRKCENSQKYV